MDLEKNRIEDIKNRGKNILVYDFDKSKKRLVDCNIWGDSEGKYVKPKEVNNYLKYHSFCIIS